MNKKVRNFAIFVTALGGVSAAIIVFCKYFKKNSLKVKRLINKNTEILNVYTYDYVSSVSPFESAKDSNEGPIASVYTGRAKKEARADFSADNRLDKKEIQKEYEQVLRFGKELVKVAPEARMVIHAIGEVPTKRFGKIKNDLELETGFEVDVVINREDLTKMFEE